MSEDASTVKPVNAEILCEVCYIVRVRVPVDPTFVDLDKGSQYTALTPIAEANGFYVIRQSDGNRKFVCLACAKGIKVIPPAGFVKVPTCSKCGRGKPVIKYCAGCVGNTGEHIHLTCKNCNYRWVTLTKDAKKDGAV